MGQHGAGRCRSRCRRRLEISSLVGFARPAFVALAILGVVPLRPCPAVAQPGLANVVEVSTASATVTFTVERRAELRLNPTDALEMRLPHGRFAGALVSKTGDTTYVGYLFEATERHGIQILPLGDRSSLTLKQGTYRAQLLGNPTTPIHLMVKYGRLLITGRAKSHSVRYWSATGVTGPAGSWDQRLPRRAGGANVLATLAVYGPDPLLVDAAFCIRPRTQPPCELASNGQTYWSTGTDEIRVEAGGHAPRLVNSAYSGELASLVASDGDWAVVVIDDPA
jgi:hypothetical protein